MSDAHIGKSESWKIMLLFLLSVLFTTVRVSWITLMRKVSSMTVMTTVRQDLKLLNTFLNMILKPNSGLLFW